MFKKLTAAGLVLALALTFAGCSEDSSGETSIPETSQFTSATVPTTMTTTTVPESQDFQEMVLVSSNDLLFKITGIENDPIWGYTLNVYMENRTDMELMFSLDAVSVNGYMCDPYFAATVSGGMKANKEIIFSTDGFEEIGITDVTDIAFTLRVYDSNDWSADALLEEIFTIYPQGQDAAKEQYRESQTGDIVLFDNESCTMIVTGFDPNSIWGYSAQVYLLNKTEDTLMFSVGDAAINGYMCDPYFAVTVAPGKQCITAISWMHSVLEENGITTVETITLPMRVYETDNWSNESLVDETFTLYP